MPKAIFHENHAIVYSGKRSLLDLLDREQTMLSNLIEEAARNGWITGAWWEEFEQELSYLVVKYSIPQSSA